MKKVICILILVIVLIIAGIIIYNNAYIKSEASIEEIQKWNDFLQKNKYITKININETMKDSDLLKTCIYSENIQKIEMIEEEKKMLSVNTNLVGYKVSKEEVKRIEKELFNAEKIQFNFITTFNKTNEYIILKDGMIYYTIPENEEKIYILNSIIEKEENKKEATVFEYDISNNRKRLNKMLSTGKIYKNIPKKETYKIIFEEIDGKIILKLNELF